MWLLNRGNGMDMSECSSPYKLLVNKRFMQRWGPLSSVTKTDKWDNEHRKSFGWLGIATILVTW